MAQVRLRRGRAYVVAAAIFVVLFFFLGTTQDWHYGSDKKLGRLQAYGSTFRHGVGDPSTEDWNPNLRKPHEGESDTLVIPATNDAQDYQSGKLEVYDEDLKDNASVDSSLNALEPPPVAPIQEHEDSSLKIAQPPFPIAARPLPVSHSSASTAAATTSIRLVDDKGLLVSTKPTNLANIVHWKSMKEHYPVPTQSLIHLPKGTPKTIPKIQHKFAVESTQEKQDRLLKLDEIKRVMNRTWYAYREHAWGHDEIMPLQATQNVLGTTRIAYRDPFAGWGATLVDTLDTLWIMGMREEFDEAVNATMDIDFTTSTGNDIPVFETTIRYLGGLLGAYDIAGQQKKYHGLVDKAVELAEVLMGCFDTPNRMPVLFYQWKPEQAVLPKSAATSVAMSEIGSLSLEFTRLAQITGEHKFYDAIARVTQYFYEWQDRTLIPGLFDNEVDASGCATPWTLTQVKKELTTEGGEEETRKDFSSFGDDSDDNIVIHVDAEGGDDAPDQRKDHSSFGDADSDISNDFVIHARKRQSENSGDNNADAPTKTSEQAHEPARANPNARIASSSPACVKFDGLQSAQGHRSGTVRPPAEYGLGGCADSTYEYLPKQWLLLGGADDSYRKMYEKSLSAFKEYLFFQPMINDSVDITFATNYYANGNITDDGTADGYRSGMGSHLACFVGGMVAMGARIYGHEDDMKLAERLTESCVWAYGTTPTGVMPEEFRLLECPEKGSCAWNQTYWYHELDPSWDKREQQIETWEINEEMRRTKEAEEEALRLEKEAEEVEFPSLESTEAGAVVKSDRTDAAISLRGLEVAKRQDIPDVVPNGIGPSAKSKLTNNGIVLDDPLGGPTLPSKVITAPPPQIEKPQLGTGGTRPQPQSTVPRPPTHEQFVESKIENEKLYPGVLSHNRKEYILRPEALESVFYLYRTTGNPAWREKGWRMFKSIEKLARTDVAYSSVYDVTRPFWAHNGEMQSFWTAETLKYIWLLFESEDVVSLDEWVLNTEAHPFRRDWTGT